MQGEGSSSYPRCLTRSLGECGGLGTPGGERDSLGPSWAAQELCLVGKRVWRTQDSVRLGRGQTQTPLSCHSGFSASLFFSIKHPLYFVFVCFALHLGG